MSAQTTANVHVGGYLWELASRAVASDRVPPQLAADHNEYQKCRLARVKDPAPMAKLIASHPDLEVLLATPAHLADPFLGSRDSYLWQLAQYAINAAIPPDLPVDLQRYLECKNDPGPMMTLLEGNPPLQEQLAFFLDYVPSRWLVDAEIPAIRERRQKCNPQSIFEEAKDTYEWTRKNNVTGICLSGGGIRSATFNLGILQGLAALDILGKFDYLSSVSGGGYIHEWLAAWIKREDLRIAEQLGADTFRTGFESVQDQLQPVPVDANHPFAPNPIRWLRRYSNYLTPQKGLFTADTWVAIAIWIRNTFLNQIVLVSLLFFLVLLPHVVGGGYRSAEQLFSRLPMVGSEVLKNASRVQERPLLFVMVALVLFVIATAALWTGLRNEYERVRHIDIYGKPPEKRQSARLGEGSVLGFVILPLLLASFLLTHALVIGLPKVPVIVALGVALAVQLAGMAFAGGAIRVYRINHGKISAPKMASSSQDKKLSSLQKLSTRMKAAAGFVKGTILLIPGLQRWDHQHFAERAAINWKVFFSAVLSTSVANSILAACGGIGVFLIAAGLMQFHGFTVDKLTFSLPAWVHSRTELSARWRMQLTFGPPLLLFVPFFGMVLMAGLVGRNFDDWLREWIARVRAWCLLVSILWSAYFGISLLGPWLFAWLNDEITRHPHIINSIKWTSVLGWIFTTAGSVLAGNSKKSTGTAEDSSVALNIVAEVGPYVFILGLLLLLSGVANDRFEAFHDSPAKLAILLIVPALTFLLFGWRVDINDFSMNPFYANRLTRCYLGATNPDRDPNPLTGFDDRDTRGLQVAKLLPSEGYSGPLPIINTTLNLSFGEDLAYQERKAASFFFSPLFSGYTVGWTSGKQGQRLSFNGFVPTSQFYLPGGGINMATAVAISGAAASPNWGFHTNPGTAFLMTLFNVRLGWWIFNPRRSRLAGRLPDSSTGETEWPSPRFAPLQLARELLGMTDDTSAYVYLSDGGHFDNMGLYELVRRRCQRIVICDAECDENYAFEGLGMAIRKCRIDFGVEILLNDISRLRQRLKSGDSKAHFVTGTIRYPESPLEKTQWGTVIYIKSSLTGNARFEVDPVAHPGKYTSLDAESADILNYKLQHSSFPHDTTGNQWFTESQFESYRRLGQHVVEEIQNCTGWRDFLTPVGAAELSATEAVPQPQASEQNFTSPSGQHSDGNGSGHPPG